MFRIGIMKNILSYPLFIFIDFVVVFAVASFCCAFHFFLLWFLENCSLTFGIPYTLQDNYHSS